MDALRLAWEGPTQAELHCDGAGGLVHGRAEASAAGRGRCARRDVARDARGRAKRLCK